MNELERVLTALLEGDFICSITRPDEADFLRDENHVRLVEAHLSALGRRLTKTSGGEAWYAANTRLADRERKEIRELFKSVKHDLQPLLKFLDLVMRVQHSDRTLSLGDSLSFAELLNGIEQNKAHETTLAEFPIHGKGFSGANASTRSQLQNVMDALCDRGYLMAKDRADRYVVTGKIHYFDEVLAFLCENEPAIQEAARLEAEGETQRLL